MGTGDYYNGITWVETWSWFTPTGLEDWTTNLSLQDGSNLVVTAWTWDTSNNVASTSQIVAGE